MIDIFLGAVIFSIWSVVLFYGKAIGLSMLLFDVPITLFIIHILEKRHSNLNTKAKILIIPIVLLSSTYLIYSNIFFNMINILIIPILTILMILGLYKEKFEIKFNVIWKILNIAVKPFTFIGEALKKSKEDLSNRKKTKTGEKNENIKRVLKALAITIPIVFIILYLLSSADQIFGNIFGNIIEIIDDLIRGIQISTAIEIIIITILAFIYFIGFFYYISFKYQNLEKEQNIKIKDSFTIKVLLGALNVIYLIFCYIQIKSLFMKNVSINYAEYARRGFFQLMVVSIINLFTVLIAKKREMQDEIKGKYIKIMSLAMVVFTFVILISASYRMYLYETAYGYTFLRLLVYCILFTEAILLIPTILYIMDKKINLAKTYFAIVITIYICMNFANFDNIIAKRNVDRYIQTGKIDLMYLEFNMGTDATRQIMRILDVEGKEIKLETRRYLRGMYEYLEQQETDFRDFNFSKLFAKQKISDRIEEIGNIDEIEELQNMQDTK